MARARFKSLRPHAEAVKLMAIVFWLIFTVAFALWWFRLALENIALLTTLQPELHEHWVRQRHMIFWEGVSWVILLFLGGAGLILLVQRERLSMRRTKEFFASFSHEVKTALASIRLQTEALQGDAENSAQQPVLTRLIGDTVRLQVQLENSLFVASQDNLQLYMQPLSLAQLVDRMREQWPVLTIEFNRDAILLGDERALRTIFSNLMQNALVHGGADHIQIEATAMGAEHLTVAVKDNGKGFAGLSSRLGRLFYRPQSSSGSGLGLYICRLLVSKMGGDFEIPASERGFQVRLQLQGRVP